MRSCTKQAVAGKNMSGVTLASTIKSISVGSVPVSTNNTLAASVAMCEVAVPFSATWRSRMPVRARIHSSLVATIFSRSALVITLGGTQPATPVIFAARRWDMMLLANGNLDKDDEFYAIAFRGTRRSPDFFRTPGGNSGWRKNFIAPGKRRGLLEHGRHRAVLVLAELDGVF